MTIGEIILLGAGERKTISVLGDDYTFKAMATDTGGAYALWEVAAPPWQPAAAAHPRTRR